MARNLGSTANGQHLLTRAMAAIAVAGALGGLGAPTAAQGQGDRQGESIDSLERRFWICDYNAARDAVDIGTGMACGVAAETLKARKFNNDFDSMLAWWREKKEAEHANARQSGLRQRAELSTR